jgi:fatty acid-binding protein DegV
MPIAIVTDSTSDLPPELAQAAGVRVVPLSVHFGSVTYRDGVTIKADDFFRRLKSGPDFPKTSQPSAGAFVKVYHDAAAAGATQVLSIHLSSKVSGTYNSAVQATKFLSGGEKVANECPYECCQEPPIPAGYEQFVGKGPQVEVIDTAQASMALGLVVLQVAEAVRRGTSFEEAVSLAKALSQRARFFGLLDTLEYLHKGGRIGRAQLFLGSVLNIKPILGLVDGVAHPVDRARSRVKGIARIEELARKEAPLAALAIMYGEDRAAADTLAAALKDIAPGGKPTISQFGPVLGTYLGPEALGICLIKAA